MREYQAMCAVLGKGEVIIAKLEVLGRPEGHHCIVDSFVAFNHILDRVSDTDDLCIGASFQPGTEVTDASDL